MKYQTKTDQTHIKCPCCNKILFSKETIQILKTDPITKIQRWVQISESTIPNMEYGRIVDGPANMKYYLCMEHFEKAWQEFKKNVFRRWSEVIWEINR